MRVEPQTSDPAKEHSHHLSDPLAVLSVVRFCGKEDGGERRSEAESGSFPSPLNPGPSWALLTFTFKSLCPSWSLPGSVIIFAACTGRVAPGCTLLGTPAWGRLVRAQKELFQGMSYLLARKGVGIVRRAQPADPALLCTRPCHQHTFELAFSSQGPPRWVLLLPTISEEEREAQRGWVSCLKSQSLKVAELGFRLKQPGSKAHRLNHYSPQVQETQSGCQGVLSPVWRVFFLHKHTHTPPVYM